MFWELMSIIVTLLVINWYRMKPFYWRKKGIPCSVPIPIFGNSFGAFFDSFHEYWNKKYKRVSNSGSIYGFHDFGKVALMMVDPAVLKEFVQRSDCFMSRGIHCNPSYDIIAKSVFFASGEEWKRIRNKLSVFFSPLRLKHLTQMMAVNMKEYSDQFEEASKFERSVNVNELSLKLSTDVVVNTIFGVKPDSFTNPNSFFFRLQEEIFGYSFILKILLGTVAPYVYDLFRVTTIPRETILQLKGFVEDVFEQRTNNIGVRQDFIQGMVELVQRDSAQNDIETFNKDDATAQCMVMYMGGTETTGNTISYLLYELAVNQEIQDRVRDEITTVLANTKDGVFTYDHLKFLTYTNMAINECLRKYPIVPMITRVCTKETVIGDVEIEVGTGIVVPIMAIHWDPKYYPEPEKFIPERFAESQDNLVFMPFGLGPRTCIGWKMAIVETAFAMCEILPKFKFSLGEDVKEQILFSWKPSLNPQDGLWLKVKKII